MKQALVRKGIVYPIEVPEPAMKSGFVKIKVHFSCISAGTELSGIRESKKSILKRIKDNPKKIQAAIDRFLSRGLNSTISKVSQITNSFTEFGYSLAGEIVEVGPNISDFAHGDLVAAAGMGFAVHAEYVVVPKNLIAKIPFGLDTQTASSATIGSIALQGIRRADLRIGEFAVVYGVGLIGLLSIQILKGSGVRVACVDINSKRLEMALNVGAEIAINSLLEDPVSAVKIWSGGTGADAVVFTASTNSSSPLSQSFKMTKKKGKVVIVGVVDLQIDRDDIYKNEIDLLISTSYGPGRYDDNYELKGIDYPYAYVRWTENRNLQEFLRLLKEKIVRLDLLKPNIYDLNNVEEAFSTLQSDKDNNIISFIRYDVNPLSEEPEPIKLGKQVVSSPSEIVRVGLIGAGSFASEVLLPIISQMPDKFKIHTVVNRGGKKAYDIANRFNAVKASSDINDILENSEIDLVLIATQHENHAELVLKSLEAGKNVFVEKPLAVTKSQLDTIKIFYNNRQIEIKPLLMVGFNRRFSEYATTIKNLVIKRNNPLFIHYRMNAGYVPSDSWLHENGGRIIGEACHIIDLMLFLTDSSVKEISTASLSFKASAYQSSDNKSFTLSFHDGSLAIIDYFSVGNKDFGKEYLEVHFDNKTIIVDDFKNLAAFGLNIKQIKTRLPSKGHKEEWIRLYDSLKKNGDWPISLDDIIHTTELTFMISES